MHTQPIYSNITRTDPGQTSTAFTLYRKGSDGAASREVPHSLAGRVQRSLSNHLFSGGEVREEVILTQITPSSRRRASHSKK